MADDWGNDPIQQGAPPAPAAAPGAADWGNDAPQQAPSRLERLGREFAKPFIGAEQLAGRVLPIPAYAPEKGWIPRAQADDAMQRENDQKIQAARGFDKGTNWEQMALDVVNPINYAGGPAVKALGLAPKVVAPAAGAISALTEPVTGNNFWQEKAGQVAGGAAGGKVMDVAGKAIAPQLSGAAKTLSDMGVRMTPGQMAGGFWKKGEDVLSNIPVLGSFVRGAQGTSIKDFDKGLINDGLKSIGVRMPDDIEAGRPAIQFMSKAISDAYEQIVPRMRGQYDPDFSKEMMGVVQDAQRTLSHRPDLQKELLGVINHDIGDRFEKNGTISGERAQNIGTDLQNMADKMLADQSPDVNRMGRLIKRIDASVDSMLDRTNPTLAPLKRAIDEANAHYKTIERAAGYLGAKDGVFTPSQLAGSIKARDKSKDKRAYAKGEALMQDKAAAGESVLPQTVRDSGTPERLAWMAALGGGGAFSLPGALGVGAGTLPYTGPGMTALRSYVNPGQVRRAIGAGIGPAAAPGVAQVLGDSQ
jgi:hypothetical protein